MKISKKQARLFLLTYHHLLKPRSLKGKKGAYEYIRKVNSIQFDPLNQVGFNPNLVLQSRVKGYKKEMLDELLYQDRLLLDGWDKCMCIYPIEDFKYFWRWRNRLSDKLSKMRENYKEELEEIRAHMKEVGPISSLDFKSEKSVDWFWAPTSVGRAVLEGMFYWGETLIHHKVNTRKYYDFKENIIPHELIDTEEPHEKDEDYNIWYVKRRIESIGMLWNKAGDAWIGVSGLKSQSRSDAIEKLLAANELFEVEVEGISNKFYVSEDFRALLESFDGQEKINSKISFIAPLDNLIWDRKLIREIFGFDYTWEVYKPKSIRTFGYYVLPILYGSKFLGRFEPVFDKKSKRLTIRDIWFEKGIRYSEKLDKEFVKALEDFMKYLNANSIIYDGKNYDHSELYEFRLSEVMTRSSNGN